MFPFFWEWGGKKQSIIGFGRVQVKSRQNVGGFSAKVDFTHFRKQRDGSRIRLGLCRLADYICICVNLNHVMMQES